MSTLSMMLLLFQELLEEEDKTLSTGNYYNALSLMSYVKATEKLEKNFSLRCILLSVLIPRFWAHCS